MDKIKLSPQEQIEHMKSKGIKFIIENEKCALLNLQNNTYYFKLKAYAKLFDKYKNTDKAGQYINLEFAYLRDLSIIDSLLRKKIFSIAIDIEHYLKVDLLNDVNDSDEDGFEIINDFIDTNRKHFDREISSKKYNKACSNLVQKYDNNFAIWNFIEIISFSDFYNLYKFFYSRNTDFSLKKSGKGKYHYLFNPVRILRNAAAHSNCLINSLKIPYVSKDDFNYNYQISSFLAKKLSRQTRNTQLSKPLIHDFCVLLYLYHNIAPKTAQQYVFSDLRDFFNGRMIRNKSYYEKNSCICSAYEFTKTVIDYFCEILQI